MKNIVYILLLTISSCIAQDKPVLFSKILKIRYSYIDKVRTIKEMTFFLEDNIIYGRISIPNTDALISAKTKINEASITTLSSFLTLAREYRKGCKEIHSNPSASFYEVTIDNENFKIIRSCDWQQLSYSNLENQIFADYIKLRNKKKK